MASERRRGDRVSFERSVAVHIVALDGTWQRDCALDDISETGAKLNIGDAPEDLDLKEFFLLLSSTGLAYRRCELAWRTGPQVGVNFARAEDHKKRPARRSQATVDA